MAAVETVYTTRRNSGWKKTKSLLHLMFLDLARRLLGIQQIVAITHFLEYHMKMHRLTLAALLVLTAASTAQAIPSAPFTDSFGLATTNFTRALSGLSYSGPGTVNSAAVTFSADIVQVLRAENTGATADVLTPVAGATISFRQGASVLQTLVLNSSGLSFNASAFDGTSDYSGTSGINFGALTATGSTAFSLTGSTLNDFLTSLGSFNVRAVGNGKINSDNANLDASVATQARYNFSVVYDITPPSVAVPEPASLALAGLALVGAAAVSRRRKH